MSPEQQRRLEELLDEAGRAVQPTAFGWETLPARLAQTPQKQPWSLGRWATAPLGLAAVAALLLIFWLSDFTPESEAKEGPIEVRRVSVDVTVFSSAETEGETLYMPLLGKIRDTLPRSGGTVRLWEELDRRRGGTTQLTGQALVKDRRLILNLKKGDNQVRFTEVATTLDPTSVRFLSLTDPTGTRVVEQGFEYDLASADAILKRYVDRPIVCIDREGIESTGNLTAYDDKTIVLTAGATGNRETISLTRSSLQALRLNELPADLVVKPTLVWTLRTRTPGKHETLLTYLCGRIGWQADYVAHVHPGKGGEPDRIDLSGWVTVDNRSGSTYEKAGLRLIAGDVNRIPDPWQLEILARDDQVFLREGERQWYGWGWDGTPLVRRPLVERSFFEYHLYSLPVPTTLRDRQIKQLHLLERRGSKATRRYVYDPAQDARRPVVELLVKNEKDNELGFPLPKGRIVLQQTDADGDSAVLGKVSIDHTAVKEELTLRYVYAFDVLGQHREVSAEKLGWGYWRRVYEITLRNHRPERIAARALARVPRSATVVQATMPYERKEVSTLQFDFPLDANAERRFRYTIETRE